MDTGSLRRYHLTEDEIVAIYNKYSKHGRNGARLLSDVARKFLTTLSSMQLGSIVSCKDISGIDYIWLDILRHAAVLEIKDTRILTALSMAVEDPALKGFVLERLQKLQAGKRDMQELSAKCKTGSTDAETSK